MDANVLLYAMTADAADHDRAHSWLAAALQGPGDATGFCCTVMLAVRRLSTHPAVLPSPLSLETGLRVVEELLQMPTSIGAEPTARHLAILGGLISEVGVTVNRIPDAHLAALAVEHRTRIITFDRDFGRFRGVDWMLPSEPRETGTVADGDEGIAESAAGTRSPRLSHRVELGPMTLFASLPTLW